MAKYSYCKIFPPICVARLGNSPTEFFVGPETPGLGPDPGGSFKDSEGRVKRQAARFRLYAFDETGKAVDELTADHPDVAQLVWKVTLANKKAEWYRFEGAGAVARVLGGGAGLPARRNASIERGKRKALIIGPATAQIEGQNQKSDPLEGQFLDKPTPVQLGQLLTDRRGRLMVLGGRGESATVAQDNPLRTFANNDAWHDDTSDGPVTAEVTLTDGTKLEVRNRAWVICGPPKFSPYTNNVVTVYDAMTEAILRHKIPWPETEIGPPPAPDQVSFTRDIFPVLDRLNGYQWVSQRAQRGHSPGKAGAFLSADTMITLSDPEAAKAPDSLHKAIFKRLRTPIIHPPFDTNPVPGSISLPPDSVEAINQANLTYMPPLAGDEGDKTQGDPTTFFSLTETQYVKFSLWKDGNFVNDWPGAPPVPEPVDELDVNEQPSALTRAALEACQGGAFFPGIEVTSILRYASFYSEALRLSAAHEAGDITKWMALPWQADFYECRDHWWPVARPDDVVPESEFERIMQAFPNEIDAGVEQLLIVRQPWARGLNLTLPDRPGLPTPLGNESADDYQGRCAQQLLRFARDYLGLLNGELSPDPNDLPQVHQRQVRDFLEATILHAPIFQVSDPKPGESVGDYHNRLLSEIGKFLRGQIQVPPPSPAEGIGDYSAQLAQIAGQNLVWQGLFDVEWRSRAANQGKNDLVTLWSSLGFVVPRQIGEQVVYIESDRPTYSLLSFREYFYYLQNIEEFADFLPKAKDIALEYLDKAKGVEAALESDPTLNYYCYFEYDKTTFLARLEKIYETERKAGLAYDPVTDALFSTPERVAERIRQLAPFNQLDGSWLEKITRSGPINDIHSFLFEIWSDEIGNGDPTQNHANVYTDLLHSAGIYLSPINSRAYSENQDIWESSFVSPSYQTAIAMFPEDFYPELLGMTLYLEWEAIYLPAMVKLYEYYGYNPLFYRLHVAIDNPVNGHGGKARDAVARYLDNIRSDTGESAMQDHFKRIWNGYLAFKFVGGDEWLYRFTNPPNLYDRMITMLGQKRHFAQLNHGRRRFGPNSINDFFDEPEQFLQELAGSDLITRGDAKSSRIFGLMSPTGPMLKVFNPRDRELWTEWINSLPRDPAGGTLLPADAMVVLINRFGSRAMGVPEHGTYVLTGDVPDGAGSKTTVTQPVSWWFQLGNPALLMASLADARNGWIIPGNAGESRLVQELLSGGGRMARILQNSVPELGNKSARTVILDWINAGCPLPAPPAEAAPVEAVVPVVRAAPHARRLAGAPRRAVIAGDDYAREVTIRSAVGRSFSAEQRLRQRRHYGPGGGAPH
jgi:hypothetical protein